MSWVVFWNLITWKNLPSLIPSSLWTVCPGRSEMESFIPFHFLCRYHMSISGISQPIEAVPVPSTPVHSGASQCSSLTAPLSSCLVGLCSSYVAVTLNLTPQGVSCSQSRPHLFTDKFWVLLSSLEELRVLEAAWLSSSQLLCSVFIPCQRHFHCVTHLFQTLKLKGWTSP